jgi:hypothetical protein
MRMLRIGDQFINLERVERVIFHFLTDDSNPCSAEIMFDHPEHFMLVVGRDCWPLYDLLDTWHDRTVLDHLYERNKVRKETGA